MDEISLVIKVAQDEAHVGTLAALFAAIAAAISAFVAYKQHRWNKRNTRVLLTPSLEAHAMFDSVDTQFELELENRGLGPARIISYEYSWEGKGITDNQLRVRIQLSVGPNFEVTVWRPASNNPCTIAPNRKVVLIRVTPDINRSLSEPCQKNLTALRGELSNRMRITITYISLLDITARSKEVYKLKIPIDD